MKKNIIFIATLFFSALFLIAPLWAQSERVKLSSSEEIAIAFYRTAGAVPDFRRWIWDRVPYKTTPPARRPNVFEVEMQRLQASFQIFNKRRDSLTIKVPVDLNPHRTDEQYYIGMTVKGLAQSHYVSTRFMEQNIALFPYGMDLLMDSPIDKELYGALKVLNTIRAKPFVIMTLKAKEANIKRPHQIDDLQQWVFKTKVQNMTLYTQNGERLWEYNAPVDFTP